MPFAAKDETLSPPMMGSGEEVLFLAAALACSKRTAVKTGPGAKNRIRGFFPEIAQSL